MADYALGSEPAAGNDAFEAHAHGCSACRDELQATRALIELFVGWPTGILRPPATLWPRLLRRVTGECGTEPMLAAGARSVDERGWKELPPGIRCKVLAVDATSKRISAVMRLAPGAEHNLAGDDLHVLDGELWLDGSKLLPGDFCRVLPGVAPRRVWTGTGCTCVLA